VDRVFTLPGIGTVVTGTLFGGTVRRGQSVVLQPSGKTTRIRRVQSHGHDVETSGPGTRTALNLADVDTIEDVHRGDVVTLADLGRSSECLDVLVEISPRASRSIKDGLRLRVHHGSGNVPAQLVLLDRREVGVGTWALGQLRLEAPAFPFVGDRFTLRDWSEQHTLAGALVLDADADRKGLKTKARLHWLERVSASIGDVGQLVAAFVTRDLAVRRTQLMAKSHFSAAEVADATARLTREGVVVIAGDFVCDATAWNALRQRAQEAVESAHRDHPEHQGVSLSDLHARLDADLPYPELFDPLIAALCEGEFVRVGSIVRRAGHRPALPEPLRLAGAKLTQQLTARPLEPPSRRELAPDAVSQRALRFLVDTGEVVEVSADLVMSGQAVADAADTIRTFIREHGPATVSELRQALSTSRRIVVPLLEYLDRTFVTLRQGDRRTLRH
jgi:selenocysteine-specific elongation factor